MKIFWMKKSAKKQSPAVMEEYAMFHPNMLEGTYVHMFELFM
jgi:hypothetical protein